MVGHDCRRPIGPADRLNQPRCQGERQLSGNLDGGSDGLQLAELRRSGGTSRSNGEHGVPNSRPTALPTSITREAVMPVRRRWYSVEGGAPQGIDLRSTHEVPTVRCEFLVGIRGGPHVDRPKDHPSKAAAECCPATYGRGRSQFSESFEGGPVVGPPRGGSLPTLPQRVAADSAAAASAYS